MSVLSSQKNNSKKFKLVTVPNIEVTDTFIIDFYKALGWNGEDKLDPCKVVLNYNQNKELLLSYMNHMKDDRVAAGMAWVLYGPSADQKVPYGKAMLLEGWCQQC